MATQRPVSEQYNLQPQQKSGSNPQYRMSADLSHLGSQQTTNHRGSRPTSEIFPTNSYQSPEAEAIDKWFEDIQHYEQTLEEMATASLDENFKDELKAIEQWFRVLSEAERTAALFSLLQHSTQVQIRFFITVLQQMARNDPMGALLSPANPDKDLMQAQLSGAMAKADADAKLAAMSLKSPTSQTYSRRLYDRHSGVDFLSPEAAIYTDPAVALAQKRARLQANAGNRSASLYQTRPKSMVSETDSNLWNSSTAQTPTTANSVSAGNNNNNNNNSNNNNNNNDRTTNGRPKSADLSAIPWTPGFTIRSPRPGAFDGELSPLVGGGSWASMVPTPVVPMFAENNKPKPTVDAEFVNKKLASWNLSNSSGNRIVLESDVKKFRRNHGKDNNSGVPATVQEEKYNHHNHHNNNHNHNHNHNHHNHINHNGNNNASSNTNLGAGIVLSMYDADGNLKSPQQSPIPSPKIVGSRQGSRPPSPNHHHNNQYQVHHGGWSASSGKNGGSTHLAPPPNNVGLSRGGDDNNNSGSGGGGGYHSDHSDNTGNNNNNNNKNHPKGHGKNKKKQTDDAVDFNLLEDIPAWLRSLRLHKYTPFFDGMKWQDIIELDDPELEKKGVAALGARRKMIKEFDKVKIAMKENGIKPVASS